MMRGAMPSREAVPAVAAASAVVALSTFVYYSRNFKRDAYAGPFSNLITGLTSMLNNKDSVLDRAGVKESMDGYDDLFEGARKDVGSLQDEKSIEKREKEYHAMVTHFYNLVTDFYEYGWGQSFHFAPRKKGETFNESILRAEYYLAARSGMTDKSKVIDVGCGVGGPMRNIHHFTGADITGVTLSEYQVRVGNKYCAQKGIDDKCRLVQGDFQQLEKAFEPETYDIAFEIEATCHSPDRVQCFKGIHKALKKGGLFTGYEWVVLPERGFDKDNKEHVRIKEGIEVGNGLPTLATGADVVKSLEDAGFEVVEAYDANRNVHSKDETPWYATLDGSYTPTGFRMTRLGRICTHCLVWMLETLYIAPKGTVRVSALLNATANDLVEGGKDEIFTPSFFFLARKI